MPDQIRRALLLNILPVTIQSRVYEHLDWLTTYEKVREKVTSLVQVGKGPGDVDCGNLNVDEEEQWPDDRNWWPEEEETDVGAVTPETQCFRCGGRGHITTTCGTAKEKGKGKCKGGDRGDRQRGQRRERQGVS